MTSFRVNATPYLIPQGPSEPTVVICKSAATGVSEAARQAYPALDECREQDWLRFLRHTAIHDDRAPLTRQDPGYSPRPVKRGATIAALAVVALLTGCASYPDTRPTLALADRALAKAEADNAAEERPGAEVRRARASMFAAVRAAIAEALKRGAGE